MVEASLLSQLIPRAKLSMMLMMMRISGPIGLICDFIAMKFVLSAAACFISLSFLFIPLSVCALFTYAAKPVSVSLTHKEFSLPFGFGFWFAVHFQFSLHAVLFCFYLSCCLSFFGSFHTSHTVQRERDRERAARRDAGEAAAV